VIHSLPKNIQNILIESLELMVQDWKTNVYQNPDEQLRATSSFYSTILKMKNPAHFKSISAQLFNLNNKEHFHNHSLLILKMKEQLSEKDLDKLFNDDKNYNTRERMQKFNISVPAKYKFQNMLERDKAFARWFIQDSYPQAQVEHERTVTENLGGKMVTYNYFSISEGPQKTKCLVGPHFQTSSDELLTDNQIVIQDADSSKHNNSSLDACIKILNKKYYSDCAKSIQIE
jgi:hypothetical protein